MPESARRAAHPPKQPMTLSKQTTFNLIFNTVGALIGLTILAYVVYSLTHTERESPCSGRYPAPLRFSLHTSKGVLMSPIELQAHVGLNEWGVIENAKVVEDADAPGGAALEAKLADVPDSETQEGRRANGLYFRWTPQQVRAANAVCLSYKLWLPDEFTFGGGGRLPGPFGGPPGGGIGGPDTGNRFAARPQWGLGGEMRFDAAATGSRFLPVNQRAFPLPKGRWMRIEQEMVLNTPGEATGIARLWLDGALKAEDTHLALRKDAGEMVLGVLAAIGYFRTPAKPGTLRIAPFELSWK
jgi:hypothetical protein